MKAGALRTEVNSETIDWSRHNMLFISEYSKVVCLDDYLLLRDVDRQANDNKAEDSASAR